MNRFFIVSTVLLALLCGTAAAQDGPEGYAPEVWIDIPELNPDQPQVVGTTFTVGIMSWDPDGTTGRPVAWRFMFRTAELADGTPVTTRAQFEANVDELVDWGDRDTWSNWIPFGDDPANNRVTFPDMPLDEYFLFAAQVIDTMGVVSLERDYQRQVAHLVVGRVPLVQVCDYYLGCTTSTRSYQVVAAGQPLNFSWIGEASAYGGNITSYRHGWDLRDYNDPDDPGWTGPAGNTDADRQADERTFQDGNHRFTVMTTDDSGGVTLSHVDFEVVPYIPRDSQAELLVIDQIHDVNMMNWLDEQGNPRNDESYRNAWWRFLENGPGGVADMDWNLDRFDHREWVEYKHLVGYKAVLVYAQYNEAQTMFRQFRSRTDTDLEGNPIKRDPFVWLAPYQARGGNLLLVGDRSMESFIEAAPNYMTPMVFDSTEPDWTLEDLSFIASFGETTLPDGSTAVRGTRLYPYATAGISLLDWTSSQVHYIYGRPQTVAMNQRKSDCAGVKGLVLDPSFKSNHGVGVADFPDTILTDAVIDWHDAALWARGNLPIVTNRFPYRHDEFVDGNISPRTTAWAPQDCTDPAAPGGLCVEPMFRGMARFDWLREFQWANGDPDWPTGGDPDYWDYGAVALGDSCGIMALTSYEQDGGFVMPAGSARTNGQVFGYYSYTSTADKPTGTPDVFWGFDPYRFDNEQMKDVVRWVLDNTFGLNVRN